MTEATLQTKLTAYMRSDAWCDVMRENGWTAIGIEVKVSSGATIANSRIADHQIIELMRTVGRWDRGMSHKISDSAVGYKPYDMVVLYGALGWLVLGYFGGKEVHAVNVEDALERLLDVETGKRKRGSLSVEWAREHSVFQFSGIL